MSLSEVG